MSPRPLPVPPGPPTTPEGRLRHSRHLLLPGFGETAQRRLAASRVLVVGAGGLGSPVLLYLAAAGVGTLGVLDDDRVDLSNLQRQVLHGTEAVGRGKVDSAVERLRDLDPGVEVVALPERLTADSALRLIDGWDVVVDGTDNFSTRYLVSDACELLGVPEVWGSVLRFDAQTAVFHAGRGPTYRDLFPDPPAPGSVPSCAEAGVLGALCGIVGSVMALETIKLLTGVGTSSLGRVHVLDALTMTWSEVPFSPRPGRAPITEVVDVDAACALPAPVPEVDVARARVLLAAGAVLVDVRELVEHSLGTVPGAVSAPFTGWRDEVPADALTLARDCADDGRPLVVHCAGGVRSAEAVRRLLAAVPGVPAVSLAGGYAAWEAADLDEARGR